MKKVVLFFFLYCSGRTVKSLFLIEAFLVKKNIHVQKKKMDQCKIMSNVLVP